MRLRKVWLAGLLLVGLACTSNRSEDGPEGIDLKPTPHAAFEEMLTGLRGKVVMLDFWSPS
jgi:hypothetical protein